MAQSQYEDLFNESEELLKQMSHILESSPLPPPSNRYPGKKRKLKKWVRSGIILFILFLLLFALAVGGGQFLKIIGKHIPLSYNVTVQSGPQPMPDGELEQTNDNSSDNMARVRVSLEIKAEKKRNSGRLVIQNLPTNHMRLRFTLLADGEAEPLFRSEMIDPGYAVKEIPLEKKYLHGKHKARLLLEFYDMEQEKKITESTMDIVINGTE